MNKKNKEGSKEARKEAGNQESKGGREGGTKRMALFLREPQKLLFAREN